MIFILIPVVFIALLLFIHHHNKPKNGAVETVAERDQRIAANIKNGALWAGAGLGVVALASLNNDGYDNGYPGGSNGGWGDQSFNPYNNV